MEGGVTIINYNFLQTGGGWVVTASLPRRAASYERVRGGRVVGGGGKTGTRGVARITKENCTITSRFIGFILIPPSGSCLSSTVGLS